MGLKRTRNTIRKQLIIDSLERSPIRAMTLSELRYRIFMQEFGTVGEEYWWRQNSWHKSFGRTVRTMYPLVHRWSFKPSTLTPIGILISDGLYRLPMDQIARYNAALFQFISFMTHRIYENINRPQFLCIIDYYIGADAVQPKFFCGHSIVASGKPVVLVTLPTISDALVEALTYHDAALGVTKNRFRQINEMNTPGSQLIIPIPTPSEWHRLTHDYRYFTIKMRYWSQQYVLEPNEYTHLGQADYCKEHIPR